MSRYMDVDAVTKRVEDSYKSAGLHFEDFRKIRRWIKTVPIIDIVCCGECKYCGKDRIKWSVRDANGNWIDTKCNCCYLLPDSNLKIREVNLDDYCSWGVRRSDE